MISKFREKEYTEVEGFNRKGQSSMKILVAGASGRVGQEVVSRLAAKGHEVVAGARRLEAIPKGENIYPVFLI